jgi:hypothetical protein
MRETLPILCDGCGQTASPEHIARRLQRLEWATRYRPIHLHTLLLGSVSPQRQAEFLYSPDEVYGGEAAQIFAAAGIETTGKPADAVHAEFHRLGLFLTHILECPIDTPTSSDGRPTLGDLVSSRLPAVFTRIRRSLKPKRLALLSGAMAPLVEKFAVAQLGCELILDDGLPFAIDSADSSTATRATHNLHRVLASTAAR